MFKSNPSKKSAERLVEEQIYAQVVDELSRGQKRDGLWGKALADSDGEETKAKALYIRYRVQSIIDEMLLLKEEERKEEEDEIARQQAVDSERQIQIDMQRRKKRKSQLTDVLLFLCIFATPYIFAWFTLKSGYKTSTRILSFTWLAIIVWSAYK